MDNDRFGTPGLSVEFYDAVDTLLSRTPIDQTQPGFTFVTGAIDNVSKIVLPAGAFYDNITAVPEPGTAAWLLGLGGLLLGRRRRGMRR